MSYKDKMLKLRKAQPQGGTIEGRSKADQQKDASPESLRRMESSVAYPTSEADTGITETPGDLGEIAYPQSDRMDAEEALLNKLAASAEGNKSKTKPNVVGVGKPKTKITDTKTKRHNYAPHTGPKTHGPHGPKGPRLDSLDDYEGKQKDEYYPVAEKVIPPENYADFTEDEAAQMSFSQSAAVKGFKDRLDGEQEFEFEEKTLPNGNRIDTIVFRDGSQYYVDPEANSDNLQPGDVIRLEPPEDKR
tara:strand:- start:18 stop:758 length:741 start_codon:yes stop_codon:yes gene_type:complete